MATGARSSIWESWAFSGSSIARRAKSTRPATSGIRPLPAWIHRPASSRIAKAWFPRWAFPLTGAATSAALTTGGGLAIVGDGARYLYVHDAATGKVLYQTRLMSAPRGFPITYAVKGRQYLAVPVSAGTTGNGVMVFTVPEG